MGRVQEAFRALARVHEPQAAEGGDTLIAKFLKSVFKKNTVRAVPMYSVEREFCFVLGIRARFLFGREAYGVGDLWSGVVFVTRCKKKSFLLLAVA